MALISRKDLSFALVLSVLFIIFFVSSSSVAYADDCFERISRGDLNPSDCGATTSLTYGTVVSVAAVLVGAGLAGVGPLAGLLPGTGITSTLDNMLEKLGVLPKGGGPVPFMSLPIMPGLADDAIGLLTHFPDWEIYLTPTNVAGHKAIADGIEISPKTLKGLTREEWKQLTDQEKQDKVREITDAIGSKLGVGPVRIKFDPGFKYAGQMDSNVYPPEMTIQSDPNSWWWKESPARVIDTIGHELNHDFQSKMRGYKDLLSNLPSWAVPKDFQGYLDAMAKNRDPSRPYSMPETDPWGYTNQLSERDSRGFGGTVADKIGRDAYKQKLREIIIDALKNPAPVEVEYQHTMGGTPIVDFKGVKIFPRLQLQEFLKKHPECKEGFKELWRTGKIKIPGVPLSP